MHRDGAAGGASRWQTACSRRGRLGPSETELVICHVSRAITRAHDVGIVHRDLKPANIVITHEEDDELAKVFDFGITRPSDAANFERAREVTARPGERFGDRPPVLAHSADHEGTLG